jgi:hypothetical protein
MSIQAVGWALEQEELPQGPKLVLVALANHANHIDGHCWLKADTIGREAACSPRSVFRYVGALIRNGYVRKQSRRADTGKQRANDYWLLFDRPAAPWRWSKSDDDETSEEELEEELEASPQDVVFQHDTLAHGESSPPSATGGTRQAAETANVAYGPSATGGSRKSLVEPSKTNPKKDAGEGSSRFAAPPRAYRPPPPPQDVVQGEVLPDAKQIFVYAGTRAYRAWSAHMARINGLRSWSLTTRRVMVDGQYRDGWFFPSLFPPEAEESPPPPEQPAQQPQPVIVETSPPSAPLMSEDDYDYLDKHGL